MRPFWVFWFVFGLLCIALPRTANGQTLPDMAIADAVGPSQVIRNQNDTVRVVVRNLGDAATSQAFDVTVYLHQASGTPRNVGDVAVSNPLAPGDSLLVKVPVRVPSLMALGAYVWRAEVDAQGGIVESDEMNNVRDGNAVLVVAPPPDMVVSVAPSGPVEANLTGTYIASLEIRNQGAGPTQGGAFDVVVYLSADSLHTGADVEVGRTAVGDVMNAGTSRALQVAMTLPHNHPLGTFFYVAVIRGVTGEVNTGNNASVGSAVEVVEKLADLIVSTPPSGPSAVYRNGAYAVTAEIHNQGTGATTSVFDVVIYLSEDLIVGNADDVRVGDVAVSDALAAGASQAVSVPVSIPALQAYRAYRWVAVVDDAALVRELDESNNAQIGQAVTVVPPLPNLTLENIKTPVLVLRNGVYSVVLDVVNTGDGPTTGAFQVSLFLSADGVAGNADDVRVGSGTVTGILAAGARRQLTLSLSIPGDQPFGTFRVVAVADAGQVEAEADETNNVRIAEVPVEVVPAPPDLIFVTDPAGSPRIFRGVPDTVSMEIRNQGQGAALSPFNVSVYLSADALAGSDDVKVGEARIAQVIEPGQTVLVRVPVAAPPQMGLGLYRWWAQIDAGRELTESDVSNNTRVGVAVSVVQFPPDLTIYEDMVAPEYVARGGVYSISVPVRNIGDGPAESGFHADVYLSQDDRLDDGDVLIGGRRIADLLAPSASQHVSVTVAVPQDLPVAAYRWIAQVRPAGLVEDRDSGNNIRLGQRVLFPVLTVSPDSLSFGLVRVGESGVRTFDVLNGGTASLSFEIQGSHPLLTVSPRSVVNLPPGVRWPVTATFSPEAEGVFGAVLTLSSNGADERVRVPLSGRAEKPQTDRAFLDVSETDQGISHRVVRVGQRVPLAISMRDLPRADAVRVLVHYDSLKLAYASWAVGDLLAEATFAAAVPMGPGVIELRAEGIGMGAGDGLLGRAQFETLAGIREGEEARISVRQVVYVSGDGQRDSVQVQAEALLRYDPVVWADFDGNGRVDILDFLLFITAFERRSTDAGWDVILPGMQVPYSRFDGTGNGEVGLSDFVLFTSVFSRVYAP